MRRKNVPQVMGSLRQQSFDRTSPGVGIINTITLYDGPPGFVESGRVVSRIDAGRFHRLDEEGARLFGAIQQDTSMAIDVSIEIFVEIEQVRQDQSKRFLPEEG